MFVLIQVLNVSSKHKHVTPCESNVNIITCAFFDLCWKMHYFQDDSHCSFFFFIFNHFFIENFDHESKAKQNDITSTHTLTHTHTHTHVHTHSHSHTHSHT